MNNIADVFKRTLHVVAITTAIVMFILYIVSHYNLAGLIIDNNICDKLSEKLQTKVEIGEVEVNWLNQIGLNHIIIYDQHDDTLLCARRATVALEVIPLLQQKLAINTIQLIDFQLMIEKDSLNGKANYDFIIEAVMPKDDNDQQRRFLNDISLNALLLRQGFIAYNVKNEPQSPNTSIPDFNHLSLTNVSASLAINISHITGMNLKLKRMTMVEQSGLVLKELKGKCTLSDDSLFVPELSARFAKELSDGTYATADIDANFQLLQDSLDIDLSKLTVDAGRFCKMDSKIGIITSLDSLKNIQYKAEFQPSTIAIQTIEEFLQIANVNLPSETRPWIEQINTIGWSGDLIGISSDSISFDGNISTSGTLNSILEINSIYNRHQKAPLSAFFKGTINSILYNRHLYQGMQIDGEYADNNVKADFSCSDPLCNIAGKTDIQMNARNTNIEGFVNIQHFTPYALNLSEWENLKDLSFHGLVDIDTKIPHDFKSSDFFENLLSVGKPLPEGYLRIDSLGITSIDDSIELGRAHLTLQKEQGTPVFAFISEIGKIVGTPTSLIGHIPANPHFDHIIKLKGEFTKDITLQSEWDSIRHQLNAELVIPEWRKDDNNCSITIKGQGLTKPDSPMPIKIDANMDFRYNSPNHDLVSDLEIKYEPDPLLFVLKPSTLTLDGKTFHTSNARIKQQGNTYILEDLLLKDKDNTLKADGTFGDDNGVDLKIDLYNWQIDFFLDILHKGYLDFGGYASGELAISSDSLLHLETQSLVINQFNYIGTDIGTGNLNAYYDFENSHLVIGAEIESDPNHTTVVDCDVRLHEVHDSLDMTFKLDSLPLDFVSYWVGGAIQDLKGHGSGNVRLYGDCDSLNLSGNPLLQNINFTHNLLGARFYLTDTINLSADDVTGKGFVGLNNAIIKDKNGQQAVITLDLEHQRLHNMEYGLDLDIPETANGFLVYEKPTQNTGDIYWGKLWATGRCQMHGTYSNHRINLQMSPAGRSVFNLSPGEENYMDNAYNFLTFRDKIQYQQSEENALQYLKAKNFENKKTDEDPTYVEANLLIHANDRCQVYIQMDPLAEDRLICRGNGDLSLHYDTHHDINLTGNYDITSGSYTVTMKGDVMTKAFQLQQGSRVSFPGSPREAELNLNAVYNIPSANLRDLDESFVSVANLSRTTLPVDCKLNVTGPITAPQIAFDLEVKNTSEDIQALVHNIIGTQEMLNREVFYLLLFSKFYTPEYASTAQRQTGSELTSFASSSLTSQLNNLLGHMSDNFTLGTNFRSDKGDFSDMEMDVSVSTRLLNDRLLMTGNLGYRDPANSVGINSANTNFIGDFDVEFLINTKGTIRAKAYSHYNDRDYSINNALTTQGIGIILRKDFKKFSDLLKRKQQIAK